tara:strand:- start:308 stop:1243 length:936 start_codon:yes stop_codon:yes gene_type:complete
MNFGLQNSNPKIMVTGGTGFVGKAIKRYKPDWIYVSSKDCDLTDKEQTYDYFNRIKPDAIIHLAAKVGGIKSASENQADFLYLNSLINLNVIHEAYRASVPRVLSCLSTCCFPDFSDKYPLVEEDLLKGEPTITNYCYAYAKRVLFLQSKYYSECYGVNYNTFTPSNIYGPGNSFDFNDSHFISSMIRKFAEAKDGDTLEFWGTGKPLRQHLYVDDLAQIVIVLLEKHLTDSPIIVSPDTNLSIKEHIELCKKISTKDVKIQFDGNLDGQFRKDASNKRMKSLIGDYKFTSIEKGLQKTYEWYYNKNRELL